MKREDIRDGDLFDSSFLTLRPTRPAWSAEQEADLKQYEEHYLQRGHDPANARFLAEGQYTDDLDIFRLIGDALESANGR